MSILTCNGTSRSDQPANTAGQIVLVFQGGGALGAYQAGVYQALHEAGIEPDWVIGTSIGAINAALIAGNEPCRRLQALETFWQRMAHKQEWPSWQVSPLVAPSLAYWRTLTAGIAGFFEPNMSAFLGAHVPLGVDAAGFYSTAQLEKTLNDLVDFNSLKANAPRLMVGAAHVRTSRMHYFDSRTTNITAKHIMASGALPPAFPAVRIDGELYWDGGILSNTPTEAIFDDYPRHDSLIFAVHLWNPAGAEPSTIWEVLHRQKDIQYSSRVTSHILRQQQLHRLRHIITELESYIPESVRNSDEVQELTAYGCPSRMHVVRLLAPQLVNEDHTKDVDFSRTGISQRWSAGYEAARRAVTQAPWQAECDPLAGVILHEPDANGRFGPSIAKSDPIAELQPSPAKRVDPESSLPNGNSQTAWNR
jgi:NTE family protein